MKQKISDIKYKNLEDLLGKLNSLIFDDEIWKKLGLWKIAEVTYSYHKNTYINETLFVRIGGLDLEKYCRSKSSNTKQKLLLKAKNNLEEIIETKIQLIKDSLHMINSESFQNLDEGENLEKEIFENALIEKLNLLEYCILSLPFELEKTGIDLDIDEDEINELEKHIKEIDKNLFGGLVRDNPEEVQLSYEYMYNIYLQKKDLLDNYKQERFEYFLSKAKPHLPVHYIFTKKAPTDKITGDYLEYDIERSDYILAFNMLVDAFGKMHHVVKSDINAGSISDGPEGIYFPANEKFDRITIERFFKLGMHEIETHSVTDYNTLQILGNLRGAQSTKKDEGTAILMEQLFLYGQNILSENKHGQLIIDKNKIQINGYFIKTLMGELLSNEELMEFLEISEIIDPDIIPPLERYRRLKRNNRSGIQHKDTTYTRGLLRAIDEINLYIESEGKKGISPRDLFIGKISFEETQKLKSLKEIKKQKGIAVGELEPIFVADAVNYVIQAKLSGEEGKLKVENFMQFLKEKYPLFDFIDDIDTNTYFRKTSRVMGIANILLKVISHRKVDSIFENLHSSHRNIVNKVIKRQYEGLINDVHFDMASHRQKLK